MARAALQRLLLWLPLWVLPEQAALLLPRELPPVRLLLQAWWSTVLLLRVLPEQIALLLRELLPVRLLLQAWWLPALPPRV
jgi:hypothetical protein